MTETRYSVSGMGCQSCVVRVRNALAEVDGLEVVDVRKGEAIVRAANADASLTDAAVTSALRAAGYDARQEVPHAAADVVGGARAI